MKKGYLMGIAAVSAMFLFAGQAGAKWGGGACCADKTQGKMHDRMAKKLNLTETQKAELEKIMQEKRGEMESLHSQMEAIHEKYDGKLVSILTDDQKKKFSEMKEKREKKMGKCKEKCEMKKK